MVKRQRTSAQSVSDETKQLTALGQRNVVSLAVAAALTGGSMAPAVALAQDDADTEVIEEIVTIGVRQSILGAVDSKRMADSVADFVDAGALGQLPDQSIADALGRVPGVTTIRDSGQSAQLNIRGMNGDFIQTTLNGREQASTAGYSEGTRWTSFDQYPAELITQAAVYKSPKATQLEGGVAGIVDLKTIDPLKTAKDHNVLLNMRLSSNDAAEDFGGDRMGGRINLSYTGKFAEDTLGVAAGVSYLEQPNVFLFSRSGADGQLGYNQDVDYNGDGNPDARSRAFQWQSGTGTDERIGYLVAATWQPTDRLKASVDFFRTEFERGDDRQGITVGGLAESASNTNVNGATVSNGVVTSATISAVNYATADQAHPWIEARTEDQTTTADADTYGINLQYDVTDTGTLTFDWYRSEGEKTRRDRIVSMHSYQFTTDPGTGEQLYQETPGQSITYALNGSGVPAATFSGIDMTNTDEMFLSRYEEYPHTYTDEIEALQLDFRQDVDWGFINSFEVGTRLADREFGADRGAFLYGSRSGQFRTDPTADGWCEDNTSDIVCQPQSVAGFTEVVSQPGVPDHLRVTDLGALATNIFGAGNFNGGKLINNGREWTYIESAVVKEETQAFYLMFNMDFNIGNIPVRGNIGVRHVETDLTTTGFQNVGGGNGIPITDSVGDTNDFLDLLSYGPTYSDTLPSLNLAFELSDKDIVRFAAARVMGRPPVGQLKGGAGSWFSGEGNSVYNVWTKGSPFLDPFRADQLDLSYEHYFDDGGAFTAAIFWKDINSLVEGPVQLTGLDFSELGIEIPPPATEAGVYETFLNNDNGGYIRGIELAATKTLSNLRSEFWRGFGATASYSYTESETSVAGGVFSGQNLPLPGLSENVWSATLFWDFRGWSANVNTRFRDDFVQNIPIPGAFTPVLAKEYQVVDAQVSYEFNNGLSLVLSGNNLTDEANIVEYGVDGALGEFRTFGRQYYFGLNYIY